MNDKKIVVGIFSAFFIVNLCLVLCMELIDFKDDVAMQGVITMSFFLIDLLLLGSYLIIGIYKVFLSYNYYDLRVYDTELNIKICNDYIRLNNINDVIRYDIAQIDENRYRISMGPQLAKGYAFAPGNIIGAEYQINFYKKALGTQITCRLIKSVGAPVCPWYIDKLIGQKLDARLDEDAYKAVEKE